MLAKDAKSTHAKVTVLLDDPIGGEREIPKRKRIRTNSTPVVSAVTPNCNYAIEEEATNGDAVDKNKLSKTSLVLMMLMLVLTC